ncbi:hypothetical protein RI367_007100 [Sorochytrium milnesiophthora]
MLPQNNGATSRAPPAAAPSPAKRVVRHWTKDAVTPGNSSMDVLLEWMTSADNYSRWRGGAAQKGVRKEQICSEIVALMREKGRDNDDVRHKIGDLERAYRKAADWLRQTGQGILEQDPDAEATIEQAMRKRCTYYYQLDPLMRDLPSTQPLLTSDDLLLGRQVLAADDNALEEHVDGAAVSNVSTTTTATNSVSGPDAPAEAASPRVPETPPSGQESSQEPPAKKQKSSAFARKHPKIQGVLAAWDTFNREALEQREAVSMREYALEQQRHDREQQVADAQVKKMELESAKLSVELKVAQALARKQLRDHGVGTVSIQSELIHPVGQEWIGATEVVQDNGNLDMPHNAKHIGRSAQCVS